MHDCAQPVNTPHERHDEDNAHPTPHPSSSRTHIHDLSSLQVTAGRHRDIAALNIAERGRVPSSAVIPSHLYVRRRNGTAPNGGRARAAPARGSPAHSSLTSSTSSTSTEASGPGAGDAGRAAPAPDAPVIPPRAEKREGECQEAEGRATTRSPPNVRNHATRRVLLVKIIGLRRASRRRRREAGERNAR